VLLPPAAESEVPGHHSALRASVSAVLAAQEASSVVLSALANLPSRVGEVIVVGELSSADASACADATKATVRVVEPLGAGDEDAIACGFRAADADIVVLLDLDANVSNVEGFISALESGANFASDAATRARSSV
jgi:hypothetical protein